MLGVRAVRCLAAAASNAGRASAHSARSLSSKGKPLAPSESERANLIRLHTKVGSVEGVDLRLITPECELHRCHDESLLPFPSPWWAFCWPGGQGLTRFIRETPERFKGARVLDIGSGCGSASIACALAGAAQVVANDIDPFAGIALRLNLELNAVNKPDRVVFSDANNIGAPAGFFSEFDIVICGDMLYDPDCSEQLLQALSGHPCVLFGDPGRTYCPRDLRDEQQLACYEYGQDGFDSIKVFRL